MFAWIRRNRNTLCTWNEGIGGHMLYLLPVQLHMSTDTLDIPIYQIRLRVTLKSADLDKYLTQRQMVQLIVTHKAISELKR